MKTVSASQVVLVVMSVVTTTDEADTDKTANKITNKYVTGFIIGSFSELGNLNYFTIIISYFNIFVKIGFFGFKLQCLKFQSRNRSRDEKFEIRNPKQDRPFPVLSLFK